MFSEITFTKLEIFPQHIAQQVIYTRLHILQIRKMKDDLQNHFNKKKKNKRKLVVANTKQENIFTRVFLNKLYQL